MDGLSLASQVQVTPRLRLTRQSLSITGAGPSHSSSRLRDQTGTSDNLQTSFSVDRDEDEESTPRRAPIDALHPVDDVVVEGDGNKSEATPLADTPANRLRALLARSPSSATPTQRYRGMTSSSGKASMEPDSPSQEDYEPITPKHPFSPPLEDPPTSIARESLRDIFSQALRDPGDTPVKDRQRRRRNSIGSSGVDESPVRARARAGRKSFSDEETERMSRYDVSDMSMDISQRSSQAAVYDSLRARLAGATLTPGPRSFSRDTMDDLDASPPAEQLTSFSIPRKASATSTPLRQSVSQFPSLYSASNLLGEDSGMRRAIKDLDSDATEDEVNAAATSGVRREESALPRPLLTQSNIGHTRTRSLSRQVSMESIGSTFSRSSSRQSAHRAVSETDEKLKERERGWNKPINAYINGQMSRGLRRSGSTASLMSSDGRASPTSSVGSSHERSHRAAGLEISHPGMRTRTMSQPSLPNSASTIRARKDSLPGRPASSLSQQRLSSLFHSPGSPRPNSPALSVSSRASSREEDADSQNVRERNWNSPRPKWDPYPDKQSTHERQRSQISSPVPLLRIERRDRASASPPTRGDFSVSDGSDARATLEIRPEIEKNTHDTGTTQTVSSDTRAPSPAEKRQSANHTPASAASTSSPSSSKIPTPSRRSEWSFPRSRSPIPPVPHDRDSTAHEPLDHVHQRTLSSPAPASRQSNRSGDNGSTRSQFVTRTSGSPHSLQTRTERRNMHRRSITEFNESVGSLPPKVSFAAEPVIFASSESDNSLASDNEAVVGLPNSNLSRVASRSPQGVQEFDYVPAVNNDANPHRETPMEPIMDIQVPLRSDNTSPPPSPSIMLPGGLLATPKRDRLVNMSKVEFHTPSPPREMPELPDPPSSSDDVDSDRTPPARTLNSSVNARIAAIRTPRPPGAWMTPSATPAIPIRAEFKSSGAVHSQGEDRQAQTPLSRTFSTIAQTPAPPGAWIATPANVRRKVQQKVRFDEETAMPRSESNEDETGPKSNLPSRLRESHTITDWDQSAQGTDQAEGDSGSIPNPIMSTPRTSPRTSPQSSRRSPRIRLVDAFGKEITASETSSQTGQEVASKQHEANLESKDSSLGRKSMLRIVDAMGREVQENSVDLSDKVSTKDRADAIAADNLVVGNREQAKEVIHKTLAELKDDFAHIDSSNESDDFIVRVEELERRSQVARLERDSIFRRIQTSAGTDEQTAKFVTQLLGRHDVKRMHIFSRLNSRAIWIYFITQIFLILVLYRLLSLGARHMFLTTYYDPFYSNLYLHVTDPKITYLTEATYSLSSNFSRTGDVIHHHRTTWIQAIVSSWYNLMDVIFSIQRDVFGSWGSSRTATWPPT